MRDTVSSNAMPLADVPHPPIAPRKPSVHVAHGDTRTDDWQWLADKQDQAVVAYLQAENAYAEAELAPTVPLQDKLFGQIRARIAETDISTPVFHEGWWYWSRTLAGQQYPVHCRRADPSKALSAAEVLAAARAALPGAGIAGDGTPPPQGDSRPMVGAAQHPGEVVLDENELVGRLRLFRPRGLRHPPGPGSPRLCRRP